VIPGLPEARRVEGSWTRTARIASAALLLASVVATATPPPRLTLTFIGNMAFAVTDGKTTLYTDFPYQSGAFGYMTYDASAVPAARDCVCLVTHGHLDHFDPNLFAKMGCALIAPPSLVKKIGTDRAVAFAPEMAYRVIEIEAFRTPHGEIEHYSYLVTWHGRRLYFTGDTESTDQLLAARDLDVAFVSPWLIEAVAKKNGRIDARRVVVYHHHADEKIAALQDRMVPKQGETFVLEGVSAGAAPR
jgi:L-ascorbate metabolism protein UlaG (beta-lactamase superfamily)